MEAMVAEFLERIEFGPMQEHENMAVLPLLADVPVGPDYRTIGEAMSAGLLSVAEVDAEGSVPELKVTNAADVSVLLLDGEELMGAKQNRVLNTSILLVVKSETIIPVSCTEHGRWSYSSPAFSDSDVVMSPSLRMRKVRSVSTSLENQGDYSSNQREVWDRVARLSEAAGVRSSTGAMRDTYRARGADLDAYFRAVEAVPGQKGLLAMIGGKAVGFDVVSREDAYASLHDKLVRSYAMDRCRLRREERPEGISRGSQGIRKKCCDLRGHETPVGRSRLGSSVPGAGDGGLSARLRRCRDSRRVLPSGR